MVFSLSLSFSLQSVRHWCFHLTRRFFSCLSSSSFTEETVRESHVLLLFSPLFPSRHEIHSSLVSIDSDWNLMAREPIETNGLCLTRDKISLLLFFHDWYNVCMEWNTHSLPSWSLLLSLTLKGDCSLYFSTTSITFDRHYLTTYIFSCFFKQMKNMKIPVMKRRRWGMRWRSSATSFVFCFPLHDDVRWKMVIRGHCCHHYFHDFQLYFLTDHQHFCSLHLAWKITEVCVTQLDDFLHLLF